MKLPAVFIDCFLVITITLMFLMVFMKPVTEEMNLPAIQLPKSASAAEAGVTENDMLKVTLKGNGDDIVMFINDTKVDKNELSRIIKERNSQEIVIRGDHNMSWGKGTMFMGFLNSLGVSGISIAYDPVKAGG